MTTPFCDSTSNTINLNPVIIPAVDGLLIIGRPSAITRLIVAAVVDALQGVEWRRFRAHVGKEVVKALPTFADGNAAPAISWVLRSFGILAALLHGAPRPVFRRVAFAMRRIPGCHLLTTQTATTQGATAYQGAPLMSAERSTITTGDPIAGFFAGVREVNDCPTTVSVANNALNTWGKFITHVEHYTTAYTLVQP